MACDITQAIQGVNLHSVTVEEYSLISLIFTSFINWEFSTEGCFVGQLRDKD